MPDSPAASNSLPSIPVSRGAPSSHPAVDAAFGPTPGANALEIRSRATDTVRERWCAAVALGAQGYYASARTALVPLRSAANPVLRSLAWSTYASLDRQMGWHDRAAVFDGRAMLEAGFAPGTAPVLGSGGRSLRHEAGRDEAGRDEALCDGLTGAAADALGTGRPAHARRLLDRCETVVGIGEEALWRAHIRLSWVRAELAMSTGDPDEALQWAREAVRSSASCPSRRHAIKSDLVLAAAQLVSGDSRSAADNAERVRSDALECSLVPLAWAAAMVGSAAGVAGSDDVRRRLEVTIVQRGGVLRS